MQFGRRFVGYPVAWIVFLCLFLGGADGWRLNVYVQGHSVFPLYLALPAGFFTFISSLEGSFYLCIVAGFSYGGYLMGAVCEFVIIQADFDIRNQGEVFADKFSFQNVSEITLVRVFPGFG